jgi:hypothetical protein
MTSGRCIGRVSEDLANQPGCLLEVLLIWAVECLTYMGAPRMGPVGPL